MSLTVIAHLQKFRDPAAFRLALDMDNVIDAAEYVALNKVVRQIGMRRQR